MNQGNLNPVSSKLDLNNFLRIIDVASALRKQQESVNQQLNINETKAGLRQKLLETAKTTGESLTEEQVSSAIDNYFDGLYSFKEPTKDISYRLAELYTDRIKIAKRVGIPTASILALTGIIWGASSAINSAHRNALERGVETAIEREYQTEQSLKGKILEISNSPFRTQLPKPEEDKVNEIINNSQTKIKETDLFFKKYCSNGVAKDDVTQTNYSEANQQLITAQGLIASAKQEAEKGVEIIQIQRQIGSTKQTLDSLIGEIRTSKPLEVFSQRAEIAYASAVNCLTNRELNTAKSYENQLESIVGDIKDFSVLQTETDKIYNDIRIIAKEEIAKTQGNNIYEEARSFVKSADVQRLKQSFSKLRDLDTTLNQDYTVKIVTRSGIKSGIDRYYTDKSGKRASGFYLIVEAVDNNGNVLPRKIINEEDGRIEEVTMWGERVPNVVYEAVKADKIDDGIIQNNTVGKKERGYLNEKILMKNVEKSGQITRW